jgi:hypothetical protein
MKAAEKGQKIQQKTRQTKNELLHSARKAAKTEQLESRWPVYKDFEKVEEDGRLYIYAPPRPPERPIRQPDLNLDRKYSPLRDVPDLILKFVSLMPRRPVSEEEMLEKMIGWAKSYGVLGSHAHTVGLIDDNPRTLNYSEQPDRVQSLSEFCSALQEAALCVGLYQAATTNSGRGDADELANVLNEQDRTYLLNGQERRDKTLAQQREWALMRAQIIVHAHITSNCYPVLSRQLQRTTDSTHETSGFFQGWGFRSLLGAMYLQMMWLMTAASNVKRCEGPGCINIITFDPPESPTSTEKGARGKYRTRIDKKFCSRNCKEKWRYHNTLKPQRAMNDR